MASPDLRPAASAGLPSWVSATRAPLAPLSRRLSAMSWLIPWIWTPSQPRTTTPSRAAGIAAVHRRVDLDEVVIGAGADVAAARRDDTGGHRAAEAEGIADGDHPVADADLLLGELHVSELAVRVVDLEEGEVGLVVDADDLRGVFGAVIHDDGHRLALVDDVVIGDDIAVAGDDETGAEAGARTRLGPRIAVLELAEEALHRRALRHVEEVLRVDVGGYVGGRRLDADAHDRRAHLLDDVGEAHRLDALDLHGFGVGRRLRQDQCLAGNDAAEEKGDRGAEEGAVAERVRLRRFGGDGQRGHSSKSPGFGKGAGWP
jgi:hypothetical protein